jgi:16S rRNA (adenine1518-N6/adenine1519-N6)-dimethyltransferase
MTRPHRARKRFGQHFLVDSNIIAGIVDAIAPRPSDTLVEIGPGRAALTDSLQRSGAKLHTVEFDRDLVVSLRRRFSEADNVTVHEADALRFDFASIGDRLRIVGNLPYNISTPLLFHLVETLDCIEDMHFMLQKEVVDRMAAAPGGKRFGRLTVMLQACCAVESLFDVPPSAFSPPPKVQSSVVRLLPLADRAASVRDRQGLARMVACAFSKRRKTLRNALADEVTVEQLEAVGIDPGARAETVPVDSWIALSNSLAQQF